MAPMKFSTRLLEKLPRGGDVATFRFDKPGAYEYRPGQWGVIEIHRDDTTLTRHFTHASSPTEPFLDVTTHVRNSDFKQALERLGPDDQVIMEGPFGGFVLGDDVGRAVFLTGGIGITPVRSILRYLADSGVGMESRSLVLLYGSKSLDEVVYREELERLDDALPYLEVLYVLKEPPEGWTGHTGYIDADVIQDAVDDMAGWQYFISGPPAMVENLRQVLRDRFIANDAITAEDFVGYE